MKVPLCTLLLSSIAIGCCKKPTQPQHTAPSSEAAKPTAGAEPQGALRFLGRVARSGPQSARYAWSGSGFSARFVGTGFSVDLDDAARFHTVVIDGTVGELSTSNGRASYTVASGLPKGEHTLQVYRNTEAFVGITTLHGVSVTDGQLLPPAPAPDRHIEFVGDSITAGYGNEGEDTQCGFSAETQNHYLSYVSVAARALNAGASTVAWSGRGVVKNYDGQSDDVMPALYPFALPSEPRQPWHFDSPADAVVVNLGTNDFSTEPDPILDDFTAAYETFLRDIRAKNPGAFVLCTVGPMLSAADLALARQGVERAVERRHKAGDTQVGSYVMTTPNEAPGCDWHPSVATHQAMADELVVELRRALSW